MPYLFSLRGKFAKRDRADGSVDNGGATRYNIVMNRSLRLKAFCKANLSLNITGVRGGMHEIDSVMTSLDAYDTVTVTERGDDEIHVAFVNATGISETDNTAYRAAKAVRNALGFGGWDIVIEKGIPIGAGLGGSSADGAAVLRALDVFYRLPARGVDMRKTALSIGSDVPFMLTGGLARVRGTGDDLFFIENKLPLFAIGLMDGGVSTRECYAEFDRQGGSGKASDTDRLCECLLGGDEQSVRYFGNALFEPACALNVGIKTCAEKLKAAGAIVNMTGSGGMVLGWFTDINKFASAAARLKSERGFGVFAPARTGVLHEWLTEKE